MFSLKRIRTLTLASIAGTLLIGSIADAQQSEFARRAEAMQRARSRYAARTVAATAAESEPAVRQAAAIQKQPERMAPPKPAARVASAASRFRSTGRSRPTASAPRVAQNLDGVIIDDGSSVVMSDVVGGPMVGGPVMGHRVVGGPMGTGGCGCGTGDCGCGGYVGSGYVDDGYYESGGCGCGGGVSCGCGESFFDCGCAGDSCCGRGGCPPGECWLAGLGGILRKAEYFGGATAFQGPIFDSPLTNDPNGTYQDCNFGFYGGVNVGIPLCRLSCGLLSGQIGVRSVQTNFNGADFTPENRDQTFVTAGVYRRVDYGIQFGIVADYLKDDWFTEASVTQIRTDLGWVFAGGATMGFRYTAAQEDDLTSGTIDGVPFDNFYQSVYDQYRFYMNARNCCGGIGELYAGWTEFDQTILGADFDVPIRERIALESTFTYFLNDDQTTAAGRLGGNDADAWNLAVGISIRPQGRAHYRSYDRPMFDVADNGTMLIRRNQ